MKENQRDRTTDGMEGDKMGFFGVLIDVARVMKVHLLAQEPDTIDGPYQSLSSKIRAKLHKIGAKCHDKSDSRP